ncbi:hypothetical protein C8R31_102444 [Nitrosospira sp. Nsp2]|nr:hypothetical protein C8R31_102444 [Nitrosospira sp. Nsp2]
MLRAGGRAGPEKQISPFFPRFMYRSNSRYLSERGRAYAGGWAATAQLLTHAQEAAGPLRITFGVLQQLHVHLELA